MWTELYGGTARDVAEALETGPLILSGLPGSGRAPLVHELARDVPVIEVRPRRAGTLAGLKLDLLNEILEASAAFAEATTRQDFARLVAIKFGPRAAEVLATVERGEASELSMREILAGLPARATVVVHDAHLLPALSDNFLWALKGQAQAPNGPWVALLTREWHRSRLLGADAPFFGFGRAVDLPVPALEQWSRSGWRVDDRDFAWLFAQTRGLPRVMLAVLERVGSGITPPAAWQVHVSESERVADEVLRLAYGLHPYGPRLLAAIATEDRVYRSVPEARSDAVATALRVLRDHDLVYQPRPRKWVVADPALVPHLAAARVP